MAYTAFRPTDNRTETSYKVVGDCILASDRNYCLDYFNTQRQPVIFNERIFNGDSDVTEKVVAELQRYARYDFTDIPKLAFLGKK